MSFPVPSASDCGPLLEALRRSRYDSGGVTVALGGEPTSSPAQAPVQSRRLGDDDQATLVRLFLLGMEVSSESGARALAPASLEQLESACFLERRDDRLRAPMQIAPFQGLLLAHDPIGASTPEPDVVTGLNSAARTLAALTPRLPVSSALDVGTGCGVQALLAARHADRVVATDVNPRALDYTRLNAELSGLSNVECREGSFFEPVAGEEFGLVVCNPPYVVSPDSSFVYRDGTLEDDEVSRVAVTGAMHHLAEGGLAQILCNWIHGPAEPWATPLKRWLEGGGCDALLLHHLTEDPLEYAAKWNSHLGTDPDALGAALDRWLEHYEERGIGAIGTGAVALRKRTGADNWIAAEEMATGPSGRGGEHVLRLFAAADLLAELDDEALLRAPLSLVEDHVLQRELTYEDGAYGEETVRLTPSDSAGLRTEYGAAVGALLAGMDGSRTAADLVPRLARALGAEPDDVGEAVAATLRTLVRQGILVPAAGSSGIEPR